MAGSACRDQGAESVLIYRVHVHALAQTDVQDQVLELLRQSAGEPPEFASTGLHADDVLALQALARGVTVDESLVDYMLAIVEKTRGFRKSSSGAWIDGIALEGHRAWYEVTGDTRAIETVLGGVDAALVKRDRAGAILNAIGFAYGQTGDAKYRDHLIKGLLQNAQGRNIYIRPRGEHALSLLDDLPMRRPCPTSSRSSATSG